MHCGTASFPSHCGHESLSTQGLQRAGLKPYLEPIPWRELLPEALKYTFRGGQLSLDLDKSAPNVLVPVIAGRLFAALVVDITEHIHAFSSYLHRLGRDNWLLICIVTLSLPSLQVHFELQLLSTVKKVSYLFRRGQC